MSDKEPTTENSNPSTSLQESPASGDDSISYVSLIADPFGLNTIEISEAQNSSEEISEDSGFPEEMSVENDGDALDLQEDSGELDRIALALKQPLQEPDKGSAPPLDPQAALADWAPDAERLAMEIIEDQTLQAAQAGFGAESIEQDPDLQAALPKRPTQEEQYDLGEMQSCIEAILFMSEKPLTLSKIQDMLGPEFPHCVFQEAMTAMMDRYQAGSHGIEIAQIAGGYQLRTKPARAALVKKLAKVQTQRLSSGAMETLAIIAYRQPLMKEDVDRIRGVDSSYFVRHLLDRKLIQISGRSELPGRPMLYSTTDDFLSVFGLKDLSCLPSLREIEQMIPSSQSANPEDEDPRIREMRKLVGQMKADSSSPLNYDPREDERILKEIRERVQSIPTSSPYLEQQKELEKKAKELAAQSIEAKPEPEAIEMTDPIPSLEAQESGGSG